MDLLQYTLHIFCEDIEEIRGRLSQCQFYSDTLYTPIVAELTEKIANVNTPIAQMRLLMGRLPQRDTVVTFYSVENDGHVSVYSDFFNFAGAFDMCKYFFVDLKTVVIAIAQIGHQYSVDIMQGEKQIGTVTTDAERSNLNEMASKVAKAIAQIPNAREEVIKNSLYRIFEDLQSMQSLSAKRVLQQLKKKAQVDEFFL